MKILTALVYYKPLALALRLKAYFNCYLLPNKILWGACFCWRRFWPLLLEAFAPGSFIRALRSGWIYWIQPWYTVAAN